MKLFSLLGNISRRVKMLERREGGREGVRRKRRRTIARSEVWGHVETDRHTHTRACGPIETRSVFSRWFKRTAALAYSWGLSFRDYLGELEIWREWVVSRLIFEMFLFYSVVCVFLFWLSVVFEFLLFSDVHFEIWDWIGIRVSHLWKIADSGRSRWRSA